MKSAAIASVGVSVASCFPNVGGTWPTQRSSCALDKPLQPTNDQARIVEVVDNQSVSTPPEMKIQVERVAPMLDRAMSDFSQGAPKPWRFVFPDYSSGMRIGLKVNCLNKYLPTSLPVVQAIVEGLKRDLSIPGSDIIVWDRRLDELYRAGLKPDVLGTQVLGTINSVTDFGGPGYEDGYCAVSPGKNVRFSRILTELTDVTINCPVLKAHEVSGVTAALKNIYGAIDNPGDFHNDLNTALPAIYALAPIRERFCFVVLDALLAVILGGTASEVDLAPKRLVVSSDPLALDYYALDLVNRMRAEEGSMMSVPTALTEWLANAHQLGLGSPEIDLVPVVL